MSIEVVAFGVVLVGAVVLFVRTHRGEATSTGVIAHAADVPSSQQAGSR